MPRPPGEKFAILDRRKNVAARYLRGQTQWEIARAFEVDQATISYDLKAIREEWLAAAVLDMDAIKAKELARIDETERQAWAAWAKSQENAETKRDRTASNGNTTERISKGQAGDPRFLEIVLKCVAKRCEIFGLIAKEKTPPPDDSAGETELATRDTLSVDDVVAANKLLGMAGVGVQADHRPQPLDQAE